MSRILPLKPVGATVTWSLRGRAFESYFMSVIKLELQMTEHEDVLRDF